VLSREAAPLFVMAQGLRGKRAAIPEQIFPLGRGMIARCWADDPDKRPAFAMIFKELSEHQFQLLPEVSTGAINLYLLTLLGQTVFSVRRPPRPGNGK
jgi:hypothetical protein